MVCVVAIARARVKMAAGAAWRSRPAMLTRAERAERGRVVTRGGYLWAPQTRFSRLLRN